MELQSFGRSDAGKVRKINQDAFGIYQKEDAGLFIIADGMGGYTNGEKASRTVVTELSNWWDSFSPVMFGYEFQRMLVAVEQVVENVNQIIYTQYNQGEICGTTMTILFLYQNYYGILHAGDSRCYMIQGRKWKLLTVDEVWENQSHIGRRERMIKNHPNRGKLINAIGVGEPVRYRLLTDIIQTDTVFLLCTDGLYKYCEERLIRNCLKKCKDKQRIEKEMNRLFEKVYVNGAKDNISVVIINCIDVKEHI